MRPLWRRRLLGLLLGLILLLFIPLSIGLGAVLLSIALAFVPAADVASPAAFEAKVLGGVVGFMALGVLLAGRGVRGSTASGNAAR